MDQNIFGIDDNFYRDRKAKNETSPKYILDNYSYYLPQLDKDFYLNYFTRELLFDIDILEVNEFLDSQFTKSKYPDQLLKVIKYKVAPSINTIIENAAFSVSNKGYFKEVKIEDGFVETEGVIKNKKYDFHIFYHLAFVENLSENLKLRSSVLLEYIKKLEYIKDGDNPDILKWCGKPSHLGLIIRYLVDEGYIKPPYGNNKEINISELSRQILSSFNVVDGTTTNTIQTYSNLNTEKALALREKFELHGFKIPDSGIIG